MCKLIDGKLVAQSIYARLPELAAVLAIPPKLVVILVGDDPASQTYVRSKAKRCAKLGFIGETILLPEDTSEGVLLEKITALNADVSVHGILVQLPLPKHISTWKVSDSIDPEKDVDGLHARNVGLLWQSQPGLAPCTPSGVIEMLKHYGVPVSGANAVVMGRSDIVGKPMAQMLLRENATVTVCHSQTREITRLTRTADILVAAVGQPLMVKESFVKEGVCLIDVGIHRIQGRLVGDVDFEAVKKKAAWLTPVPGGVGPMTIAMLMKNLVLAATRQQALAS